MLPVISYYKGKSEVRNMANGTGVDFSALILGFFAQRLFLIWVSALKRSIATYC